MADLERFNELGLSTYLLKKLQSKCIATRYDLLITSKVELMQITGLPEATILEIKQNIGEDYFPPQQSVLCKMKMLSKIYNTGIENLDILTTRIPLKTGSVWEICGKASVGKTQLCHTITINFVTRSYGIALYVDTKSDFSGTRIMEMLRSRNVPQQDCGRIMQDIFVERTTTAEGICDVFEKLLSKLTTSTDADESNIKLVIIDALPAVFFSYRNETNRLKGKYLLAKLNNLVYKLAKEHRIAFIYVNLLLDIEEDQLIAEDADIATCEEFTASPSPVGCKNMRPALGEYWNRAPQLRLSLERSTEDFSLTNERKLTVLRSCYTGHGDVCRLRITSAGVL